MKAVLEESFCREVIDLLNTIKTEQARLAADRIKDAIEEDKTTAAYQEAVRYHRLLQEGTLEVDDNATVSHGDDGGAYVQAWLWVDEEDMRNYLPAEPQAKES